MAAKCEGRLSDFHAAGGWWCLQVCLVGIWGEICRRVDASCPWFGLKRKNFFPDFMWFSEKIWQEGREVGRSKGVPSLSGMVRPMSKYGV